MLISEAVIQNFYIAGDLFDMLLPMLSIYQEYVRNHHYSLQVGDKDMGVYYTGEQNVKSRLMHGIFQLIPSVYGS